MFDAALGYSNRGWITHRVQPPKQGVKKSGKAPIDNGWQKVTTPPTEDRLKQWFGNGDPNNYNIGLLCGERSGVTVIDLDRMIYADIFNNVKTLRSSRTTGRGHVFFKYHPRFPASTHHNLGIEVLSTGNNAILPPSIHESGDVYKWNDPDAPLLEMPKEIETALINLFKREKELNQLIRKCRPCFSRLWKKEIREVTDFHGAEGRELMVAWGADMKAAGATLSDAEMWGKIIYGDGFDAAKTITEWRNIDEKKTWRCETVAEKLGNVIECKCEGCRWNAPKTSTQETPKTTVSPDVFLIGDRKTFDVNGFAKWLIFESGHTFATLSDTEEVLQYEDGFFRHGGDIEIGKLVEQIMDGFKVTKNAVNEIIGHVRRRTYVERMEFDSDKNIINLANGLYDIQARELKPHTSEYLSLHKSPIVYDPEATCPRIDQFFAEVLLGKHVPFMYELFGYALLKEKQMDTAVLFEGSGANGKSRMIGLLDTFVGSDVTAHVTPGELSGDDKFAVADLFGKLLNTIDDLGNTPLKNLGVFKSIISGAEQRGQYKYENAFKFAPTVLCVFGCNEVPMTTDTSDGFFRRMITVPFLQRFDGDTADKNLFSKLTTQAELSGLFNKAMEAVTGVLDDGNFTCVGTIEDRKQTYLYASNPVARFCDECCSFSDPDDYISKDELYNQYVMWARENHIRVKPKGVLTTYLEEIGCVVRQFTDDNNMRYRAYVGVRMNNEEGSWF